MRSSTRRSSPVGDVLPQVLSNLNLEKPLREYRAVEVWQEVVGERLYKHARAVSIHQGTLLVEADTSVWMQEIQFLKRRILNRLEHLCGEGSVRELRCVMRSGPWKV